MKRSCKNCVTPLFGKPTTLYVGYVLLGCEPMIYSHNGIDGGCMEPKPYTDFGAYKEYLNIIGLY